MYCKKCGKPRWSWVHNPTHPANRGNESVTHYFVEVGTPDYTYRDDTFNNVMDDALIAWATDGGSHD